MASRYTDIIIPTYNNSHYTLDCLYSIKQNTNFKEHIVWVDNGSDSHERDNVHNYLKEEFQFKHTAICLDENTGFIKAVNEGLRHCQMVQLAEYICIQNNDTVVEPQWLDKMVEVLEKQPCAGLVGPTTIYAESWQNRENLRRHWGPEKNWPVVKKIDGMLAFFCTVFKPEVFNNVGLLDEDYGLGFGDDDAFCEDAKDAGYELYLRTDVTVPHFHRTTFKKYIPDWEQKQQENIAKFKRNYGLR